MISLTIDNKNLQVEKGTTLLEACLGNGIFVPNLCFLHTKTLNHHPASCRLCFVEVVGLPSPVASCVTRAEQGMMVKTDTPEVKRLQKSALKLLLSVHDIDCKNCSAHKHCQLQDLARHLGVRLKADPQDLYLKEPAVVSAHPVFDLFPNKCVLSGKCIAVCAHESPVPVLTFLGRGMDTMVGFYQDTPDLFVQCSTCRKCLAICPVGAIVEKKENQTG